MYRRIDRAMMAITKKMIDPIAPDERVTTVLLPPPLPLAGGVDPDGFRVVDGVKVVDGVIETVIGIDGLAPVESVAVGVAD
jgi:hypothetical protein